MSEESHTDGPARDPSSMFEILQDFKADGYVGDLYAEEGGDIRCGTCNVSSPAGSYDVTELRRMEGASDPADMAAVVAAPCPSCGTKGVLVVMYGPEAGPADQDVLLVLPTPATPDERPGSST